MAKSAIGHLPLLSDVILKSPSCSSKWLIWNRVLTKILHAFLFSFLQNPIQFTTKKKASLPYTEHRHVARRKVVYYYSYRQQTGHLTHMNMEFQRNCARIARLRSTLNQHFSPMLPVILFARSTNCKYSKCQCLHDNNYATPVASRIQHGLSESRTFNITLRLCCSLRALSITNRNTQPSKSAMFCPIYLYCILTLGIPYCVKLSFSSTV